MKQVLDYYQTLDFMRTSKLWYIHVILVSKYLKLSILTYLFFLNARFHHLFQVYDGVESEDNILGSFNTAKVPPDVFTTGNVIVITMTTDHSGQYKGFSADIYETIL